MSAGLIALFFGLGVGAWTYNKLRGHAGSGNQQTAVMAAAAVFVVGFVVLFTLIHSFLH